MNIQPINNNVPETSFNGRLGYSVKRCIRKRAKADLKLSIERYSHQDKNEIREIKKYYRAIASRIIGRLKRYCKEHTQLWSVLTIVPASSGIKGEKELAFYAPQNKTDKIVRYSENPQDITLNNWSEIAENFEKHHSGYDKNPPADLPWDEQFRRMESWEEDQRWFLQNRGRWNDGGY